MEPSSLGISVSEKPGRSPPLLAIWGENDPFFLPTGAKAFKRDLPESRIVLLNAGHFALETHPKRIAAEIRDFIGAHDVRAAA